MMWIQFPIKCLHLCWGHLFCPQAVQVFLLGMLMYLKNKDIQNMWNNKSECMSTQVKHLFIFMWIKHQKCLVLSSIYTNRYPDICYMQFCVIIDITLYCKCNVFHSDIRLWLTYISNHNSFQLIHLSLYPINFVQFYDGIGCKMSLKNPTASLYCREFLYIGNINDCLGWLADWL